MKKYPIQISMSNSVHDEWMAKEEGSYEDNGQPKTGHVYCLLSDNYNRKTSKLTINNEGELAMLKKSANYHVSWDEGESAVVDRLMKKAAEVLRITVGND